tara:strand:+ start:2631 stop:3032 length:402 start_codon:yes stop_codon:yes gene_type:complete
MEKELNTLLKAIAEDYRRWNTASKRANDFSFDVDEKVAEFEAGLEIKKGRKFIKILCENRVWGFVNLTHERFREGDILKAAGYNAPALNRPRGNIFENYSVAWTGPHYIAGYSAGGSREDGLNRGNSRTVINK